MLPDDAPYVADKLEELGITAAELAYLIRADLADVEAWAAGTANVPGPIKFLLKCISRDLGSPLVLIRDEFGPILKNGVTMALAQHATPGGARIDARDNL
ncbi:hypothetical protein [Rhodospira trueperi]|uniref:Uncharacterized protein n=1 Tax=Rhodospira trueperi TaxID=69960 RepID=A0A1G7CWT8_9PROT|nr:hypothetical protein [Rhodospira trueperi]SDE42955.1 hypothetical protein SAMN05421720_106227 [Rhodospira trueperi]